MKGMVKFLFALLLALSMVGCTSHTRLPKFPGTLDGLQEPCPQLSEVKQGSEMSDFMLVVSENYSKYHLCKAKVDAWILWYTKHKEIYEELK